MSFLKAEWRKLAFANYEVDPTLLEPHVPAGTELDLWNGKCFVSLIGFMFLNTKLLGIKVPFHVNFEEVNLRFYVKKFDKGEWKRGVVFIKEIVPKPALTWVANTIYKENYEAMPMKHSWQEHNDHRIVEYQWKKASKWNSLRLRASLESKDIIAESETEFITEHYWGYAHVNDQKSNEYEVTHPKWKVYDVIDHDIDVDFGTVYGKKFDFLGAQTPHSLMLAEGSAITVEGKSVIKSDG